MFYRIVAFTLVVLGILQILQTLGWSLTINKDTVELSATGLAAVFLGLLNLGYLYEIPNNSQVPKVVLLTANLIFIGFAIASISTHLFEWYGYLAIALSVINCIMVINHKV